MRCHCNDRSCQSHGGCNVVQKGVVGRSNIGLGMIVVRVPAFPKVRHSRTFISLPYLSGVGASRVPSWLQSSFQQLSRRSPFRFMLTCRHEYPPIGGHKYEAPHALWLSSELSSSSNHKSKCDGFVSFMRRSRNPAPAGVKASSCEPNDIWSRFLGLFLVFEVVGHPPFQPSHMMLPRPARAAVLQCATKSHNS